MLAYSALARPGFLPKPTSPNIISTLPPTNGLHPSPLANASSASDQSLLLHLVLAPRRVRGNATCSPSSLSLPLTPSAPPRGVPRRRRRRTAAPPPPPLPPSFPRRRCNCGPFRPPSLPLPSLAA